MLSVVKLKEEDVVYNVIQIFTHFDVLPEGDFIVRQERSM